MMEQNALFFLKRRNENIIASPGKMCASFTKTYIKEISEYLTSKNYIFEII